MYLNGTTARPYQEPDINSGILVVRLGAMGDILHALPAAASLKHSFPSAPLTWLVESTWAPLLEQNSFIDRVICLDRKHPRTWLHTLSELRAQRFSLAMDFQGLIKSAVSATLARPERIIGFDRLQVREKVASWFYSNRVSSAAAHVVDRNLDIAAAAGAVNLLRSFPLPSGRPEGELPGGRFVLASPRAGWKSKQWPLEYFAKIAEILKTRWNTALVLNGPASDRDELAEVPGAFVHVSGISGLIYATRRATAIIGVDSGPMHLAAALAKPGVAIFGPTDPSRNGPYGGSLQVLRSVTAITSYKRRAEIDESMREVTPEQVADALAPVLE
jgi:heptosyltransferase-1